MHKSMNIQVEFHTAAWIRDPFSPNGAFSLDGQALRWSELEGSLEVTLNFPSEMAQVTESCSKILSIMPVSSLGPEVCPP